MAEAVLPLTLGIDLGTSAVKVVVLNADGVVVAAGSAAFATVSDLPDQAEQDPGEWIAALGQAVADLNRVLAPRCPQWREGVAAIGLTGQLPTLVSGAGRSPAGPAITWKDARADRWASTAIDPALRRALYERTGMPIDGRYLGPMFRYHGLAGREDVEWILSAKDYLGFALTDQRVTDPSTAAGYGAFELATGRFSDSLCELWGLPPAALPAVAPAHAVAGPLTAPAARLLGLRAGVPVTVGAADSVASAFAMTGLEEGVVCITMGSSTIIIDAIREPRLDPQTRYLLTPHVEPGWWGREMDLLATGTGYRWLSDLLGWEPGLLEQRATQSSAGAGGIAFAPYLAGGEQGALWDPTLRGAIRGLTVHHTASDIARAFLEGVCFEIRRCVEVLAGTAPVRGIVLSGHLAEHRSSVQMLADILQRPVQPFPSLSPAALGAALGALHRVDSGSHSHTHPTIRRRWPSEVVPGGDANAYQRLYADHLAATR